MEELVRKVGEKTNQVVEATPEDTPEETAVPIEEPETEPSPIEEPEQAPPSEEPETATGIQTEGKLVLTIIESSEVKAKQP